MSGKMMKFDFYGDELDVVVKDGRAWIGVRAVCRGLGIDNSGQWAKLKEKVWATVEMQQTVAEDGKQRKLFCIDLESLPMWLATIETSKVAEKSRAKLERYQLEVAKTVAKRFAQHMAAASGTPEAPLPASRPKTAALPAELRSEPMDITPEIAALWLEKRNERNRAISRAAVTRYAADMIAGKWAITHQGIAFGPDGEIIDGQHRLSAIVQANVTVRMYVSYYGSASIALDGKLKTDTGRTRGNGNVIELAGVVEKGDGNNVAAIVACIWGLSQTSVTPSAAQVSDFFEANKEAILWSLEALTAREFTAPIRAAFVYAYPTNKDVIGRFALLVSEKSGLRTGSAAHTYVKAHAAGTLKTNGGTYERKGLTLKVLRLLKAHVRGEKLARVMVCSEGYEYFRAAREKLGLDAAESVAAE